jgi:hypothetical protein
MSRPSLSLCILTSDLVASVQLAIDSAREVCDEVVVVLDSENLGQRLSDFERLQNVDKVFMTKVDLPIETALFDVMRACSGDWVFRLDSDEVMSADLREDLSDIQKVMANSTHAWVQRRWLWPDESTFLSAAPWYPDLQLRLFRNVPQIWRLSRDVHRPAVVEGDGCILSGAIYHRDLVESPRDRRESKAKQYELMRPGLRTHSGSSTNFGLYLPELSITQPSHADVPQRDRLSVMHSMTQKVELQRSSFWPPEPLPRSTNAIEADRAISKIEISLQQTGAVSAGNKFHVLVKLFNRSDSTLTTTFRGTELRLGARWLTEPGKETNREWRAALPRLISAGQTVLVPIEVEASIATGEYVLEIGLLTETVEWHMPLLHQEISVMNSSRSRFSEVWESIDSVEGWLSIDEAYLLYSLARIVPSDSAIVEIGSYKGRSTTALALGASGASIYAIDPHTGDRALVERGEAVDTYDVFVRNLKDRRLDDRTVVMRTTSADAAANYSGPPFSLIFIDGWHSTDAVIEDYELWSKHAAADAVYVFDDWNNFEVGEGIRSVQDRLPPLVGIVGKVAVFGPPGRLGMDLVDGGPAWRPGEGLRLPDGIG